MKETKKMQIMPQDEERIINAYSHFGWELVSSQEIKTKDSHLEQGAFTGTIYSVTESENYVNLIFSRDTSIANYRALVACQKEYEEAQSCLKAKVRFRFIPFLFTNVFYLIYYFARNAAINKNNDAAFEEMNAALQKARKFL